MKKTLWKSIIQVIPAVIIGGLSSILALYSNNELLENISTYSFYIVPSLLAGFIAKEIAGNVGFIPAIIVGGLSVNLNLGIIGGFLAGILIGSSIQILKKLKFPIELTSILYFIIIPIFSTIFGYLVMNFFLKIPLFYFIKNINLLLNIFDEKNSIFLIFILGGMIGADLGGPINKIAYLYAVSMLNLKKYDIMGAIAVAICIPPLSLGIAHLIFKDKFIKMGKEASLLSIILGILGITEGALLFIAEDVKILLISILSAAFSACIAYILGVSSLVPHGGIIILPLIVNKFNFLLSIILGITFSISLIYLLYIKK